MTGDQALVLLQQQYDPAQAAARSPTSCTRCWYCGTSVSGHRRRTRPPLVEALEKRPNQAPLVEALKSTVAYQRKLQAQAAAQQAPGANPGFAIGGAPAPFNQPGAIIGGPGGSSVG